MLYIKSENETSEVLSKIRRFLSFNVKWVTDYSSEPSLFVHINFLVINFLASINSYDETTGEGSIILTPFYISLF